jgi:hypothetical protein
MRYTQKHPQHTYINRDRFFAKPFTLQFKLSPSYYRNDIQRCLAGAST